VYMCAMSKQSGDAVQDPARRWGAQLDAWVHLGDYYYEYGDTTYPAADEAPADRWATLQPR